MAKTQKCAHPSCKCQLQENSQYGQYCSAHCKNAGDSANVCHCHHPGCAH